MTAEEFIAAAETWIGVPWLHQGRSRHGVDCVGLPESILREAGALPPDYAVRANYGRLPARAMQEQLERWCRPTSRRDGCLVQIRWPSEPLPSHLAILAGESLIHAYKKAGGVAKHPYRAQWLRMTVGFWLAPGVTYE